MKRDDADELEQLKLRMTPEQQEQMAQLVAQEVRRRNKARAAAMTEEKRSQVKSAPISSKLSSDDVKEMYTGLSARIRKLRVESAIKARRNGKSKVLDRRLGKRFGAFISAWNVGSREKVARISKSAKRVNWGSDIVMPFAHFLLFAGVFTFGLLKLSTGVQLTDVGSLVQDDFQANASVLQEAEQVLNTPRGRLSSHMGEERASENVSIAREEPAVAVSPQKEELLTRLDERRAELESRRNELDRREQELTSKDKAVTVKLIELKELTQKVEVQLKAREKDQAERLEQMANVYASMQPKDAATLLEKLDNEIALRLLAFLPGKRMGQILSLMDQNRAVELTKQLSGPKNAK